MKYRLIAFVLGTGVVLVHSAPTRTQVAAPVDDLTGPCDGGGCPANVSSVIGRYGPTAGSTNDGTVGYAAYPIGAFQAGTSVRVGTCGMAGAEFTGNTILRLFIAGTTTQVALNDDNCAGRGSQINYVVPRDVQLELHAGCSGASVGCGGAIALTARLDATPRPVSVKAAFQRIVDHGVLGISPDIHSLIRGIYYQGGSWGGKYHHQGIARTYTRAAYDIVWTTSVRSHDGDPEFYNVFFSRMGTKSTGLRQRFGTNAVEVELPGWPPRVAHDGSPLDAIIYGSNAGVYDPYDTDDPQSRDWDGVPLGRKFDHGGGIQAIGNYAVTASEFVTLPCLPYQNGCPAHGDQNIPPSGQASQVVTYDISARLPRPSLLIARKNEGSGWVAIAKLGSAQAPPVLRNGYLLMVPDGDRLSLYAIPADPCTGYASLAQVRPSLAMGHRSPPAIDPLAPPICPGVRSHAAQTAADVRQLASVGCVKRTTQGGNDSGDPACPNLSSMYEDGERKDFPAQADIQSANFVTQADGQLYLLAFEGQQVELSGPNSEIQLWRVVFGTASGIAAQLRRMPDGTECESFLCLVRAGTEDAHDSYKNMHVDEINGAMFRFGGGAYIVPHGNPALETFFIYGTEHYLQRTPRAALFNEF
jgi:hypothetical protein